MVKSGAKSRAMGSVGPFKLALQHNLADSFTVTVKGAQEYGIDLDNVLNLTPVGTAMRVMNLIRNLPDRPALEAERLSNIDKTLPRLREQLSTWDKSAELDEARQQHANVMSILRPVKNRRRPSTLRRVQSRSRRPSLNRIQLPA
ncbi:hypothetical protein HED48_23370 [Ochrobactrum intermedium]|nr:hypothetical protein [Brucella intermedia]